MNDPRGTNFSDSSCGDSNLGDSSCQSSASSASELNQSCYCKTLDQKALYDWIAAEFPHQDLSTTYQQFFSNVATFISPQDTDYIRDSIQAIERVIHLNSYQERALAQAHPNAQFNTGTSGAFIGYDFHLMHGHLTQSDSMQNRPQLIEINTNAGGGFLNGLLRNAQLACCPPMSGTADGEHLFNLYLDMFLSEWRLQRGNQPLKRIAIVDTAPQTQFLFPEFILARSLFESRGIEAVIASPESLSHQNNQLCYDGKPVDLVYNRLTDFALGEHASRALNMAYQHNQVVVTPSPYHYAIYADKRNLTLLSDEHALREIGASEADIKILLASIPSSIEVHADNAAALWKDRRHLFFKPASGYGSKATYRGDKLTKSVWEQILKGHYIAQKNVSPSERSILLDEQPSSLKMDVRAYSYQGNIQLLAARLYQGQTTNFRTPGGGFSPVFIA
jgi:hypothetical protein